MKSLRFALFFFAAMLLTACGRQPAPGSNSNASPTAGSTAGQSQLPVPFRISLQQAANQPAPALQSFPFAQSGGKWLLMGGRTQGFHGTSGPGRTFPSTGSNGNIYLVDVANNTTSSSSLPAKYVKLLRSTNMEDYQDGNVLYLAGGYGSTCNDDKPSCYQTFPNLTAIKVPDLIQAILNGKPGDIEKCIVSITDERFRVAGGELRKIGDYFYLIFGQNYSTIYKNALTGKYTEQISRFKINFDGQNLSVSDYTVFTDPSGTTGPKSEYHRRDLNVVEAIRPDGTFGLTVYGGVFTGDGTAYRYPIYIDQTGGQTKITVDTSFEEKMSQYECAAVLVYDPASKNMYTTLLGGISLFDYVGNQVEENKLMPFIKAITTLRRGADGNTLEVPQAPADSLPEFIGAEGVFIADAGVAKISGTADIIDYSKLPSGKTRIGYLYGGIRATAPQSNEANPTFASNTVYEVYIEKL